MTRALIVKTLLLLSAIVASLGAEGRVYAQNESANGTMNCGFETRGYKTQGQPIVFRFTLQNLSSHPVDPDLGYDREGALNFKLERPDGSFVALPQKQVREGISLAPKITIPERETYSQQIILDDWYKFAELGSYVVTLTMPASICSGPMDVRFEILPADAERLNKFSLELANSIRENKNNYEKASEAAKVLARVDNSLVVPHLINALDGNPMVHSILIPALERIGDKNAIRSLISLLESDGSTSSKYELVRSALMRLESKSPLEEAQMIRVALARFPAQ